jgi:BspA type Leucine rich repeat region (6 copies)
VKIEAKLIGLCLLGVVLLIFPNVVQAQFSFTTNSGTITITGYAGTNPVVLVPASTNGLTVTSIGDDSFAYNLVVTSVVIPSSVTNIGIYAFYSSGLTNVSIGSGLTTISSYAFEGCGNLLTVAIPNNVISIGDNAFESSGLTNVTFGSGVTNIGGNAFLGCPMVNISVDPANQYFSSADGVLFNKNQTALLYYPQFSLVGNYTIPNSVTNIGVSAFNKAIALTNLTFGNNVSSIGLGALENCLGLTSVTLPNSLISIDGGGFWQLPHFGHAHSREQCHHIGNPFVRSLRRPLQHYHSQQCDRSERQCLLLLRLPDECHVW